MLCNVLITTLTGIAMKSLLKQLNCRSIVTEMFVLLISRRVLYSLLFSSLILGFTLPVRSAPVLLQNGGFEAKRSTLIPEYWRADSWKGGSIIETSDTVKHSGRSSVLIECTFPNDARIIQTVPVKSNTLYRLSGWVKVEGVSAKNTGANICVMDSGVHSEFAGNTDGWKKIECEFKTYEGQFLVNIGARLGFYNGDVIGKAYFDDLQLDVITKSETAYSILQKPAPAEKKVIKYEWSIYTQMAVIFYIMLLSLLSFVFYKNKSLFQIDRIEPYKILIILAVASVLIRIPLISENPFPTDMGCFKTWALRMADVGPSHFYAKNYFCDYPPFSLYILGISGLIAKISGIIGNSFLFNLVIKLPAMLCDFATAWVLYKCISEKNKHVASVLSGIYLLLPCVMYNSTYWGQVDSIYSLLVVSAFYMLKKDKPILVALLLAASMLTKTQTVAFAPIVICAFIIRYNIKTILISGAVFISALIVMSFPFYMHYPVSEFFEFYFRQANHYPYGSVNAANLLTLFGGNFTKDSVMFLPGLSFKLSGFLLFAISIFCTCYLYIKNRSEQILAAALFLSAFFFFMLFPAMHERYLFAAFPFLMITAGLLHDRLFYFLGIILTTVHVLNLHAVILKYTKDSPLKDDSFARILYILSLVTTLVGIAYLLYFVRFTPIEIGARIGTFFKKYFDVFTQNVSEKLSAVPFRIKRKDIAYLLLIAVFYTVFIFIRLGTTDVPSRGMLFKNPTDAVQVTLPVGSEIATIVFFDAEGDGALSFQYEKQGVWTPFAQVECKDFYLIKRKAFSAIKASNIRIIPEPAAGMINEIAFLDPQGNPIEPGFVTTLKDQKSVLPEKNPLFDEQKSLLKRATHLNSTYFDEIYHGRTAYEFIKGDTVYETTHPHLGKIVLMPGIKIFGMNTFGMRFMHAVMGIVFIIVLFFLGREVFATRFGAFGAMMLGFFDFMPFVQSRYATVDTTSVLLITVMLACAVRYFRKEISGAPMKSRIRSIAFILVSFAAAVSVKWTAVYGFTGIICCLLIIKTDHLAGILNGKSEKVKAAVQYIKSELLPLSAVWIGLLILIVPILYFIPHYYFVKSLGIKDFFSTESFNAVLKYQKDMFLYHSQLTATHAYSSSWWSWPFDFKPLFLYQMSVNLPGMKASIVSMGNPLIWWTGLLGIFVIVYRFIAERKITLPVYLLVLYLASYLPWVLVTRATFIYHYYPLVPLVYMFVLTLLEPLYAMSKAGRRSVLIFFAAALLLLILFYPVLSGIDIPGRFNTMLKLFAGDWWWS
jgi:dolichyl-phosphate-mannose-protein mannosyltransferase